MANVDISREGELFVVTINRPEVKNAVDGPAAAALVAAFDEFEQDQSLSVAILTGAGGEFCAGADLKAIASEPERALRLSTGGPGPMGPTRMQLTKPVLAAVEGHAVGGGLELALWCDLRVASETAVFGVFNRRFGVPLIDGGTVRLPRLLGQGRALDLILTGRAVAAEEALEIGLADRLVETGRALDEALVLAGHIARFPQESLRADRVSALTQWGLSVPEAIRQEFALGVQSVQDGESIEGARRFEEGRGRHGSFSD